jgi:hypothetical protein
MRQAWQEFRTGWHDARWSFYAMIALLPIALVVSLAIQISRGQVPPQVVTWFYATIIGFVSGVVAVILFLVYRERLQIGVRQLLADTRQRETGRQLAGVRGGAVGNRPHPRRRPTH